MTSPDPTADQSFQASGDQPLDHLAQDGLGRKGFVNGLVDEIRAAPATGYVIGVTGPWGSGKTSVINMAVNTLDEEPDYRILRFNPWLFTGTPQLVEHFFAELAAQLREAGRRRPGERLATLGTTIEQYGSLLDPLRFAPGVDTAVRVSGAAGKLFRHAGKQPTSVRSHKDALDEMLGEHDERLVVVIDDIDRLEQSEIRDVMRLVRLVGDFPNVVYVLAFATDIVARALGNSEPDVQARTAEGHVYLEKIVQVTHPMPSIDDEAMSQLVLRKLEAALDGVAYDIDIEHWSTVYPAVRGYFRTMRDVLRYANAIRAPARHLITDVDVADIIGLEALRHFEPAIWARLAPLARALTSTPDSYLLDSERTADEELVKALASDASDANAVNELLPALFPAAARLFRRQAFGSSFSSDWRRKGRVAHPDVFRIYLSRQVAPDQASRADARAAVKAMLEPDELRRQLQQTDDERLPALFSRIEDYEDELGIECAVSIPILYEQLPRLPDRAAGILDIDPEIRVTRVVYRIVKGHPSEAIAEAVEPVLSALPWISDRVGVLRTLGWKEDGARQLVEPAVLDRWARETADEASDRPADRLDGESNLGIVISLLGEFRDAEAVSEWVRARVSHIPFFLRLLTTYMGEVRSSAGRFTQLSWDRLADLLGEDLLVATVTKLPTGSATLNRLTDDEREMISQARKLAADPDEAHRVMDDYRRRYGGVDTARDTETESA